MPEPYIEKYSSSYTFWLYILAFIYASIFFIFYAGYDPKTADFGIDLMAGLLIGSTILTGLIFMFRYRAIFMYDDRMVMKDAFNNILLEIQYNNIARIGFLNATTGNLNKSAEVDLVMLLHDGGEEELYSDQVPYTNLIYDFIRKRIGG